jgi:hypothetical protein
MIRNVASRLAALVALLPLAVPAFAQSITLPPSGDNQRSSVSQWIGLVEVNVTYSSPDVTAPDGTTDRRGKIWGDLVPWGWGTESFGTCGSKCPWRAGSNENTVFRVSHDVEVEGQPLPAGAYGLHTLPGENEWTIIFSKNSTSWGSFFYDEKEDALRVTVKPAKSEYHHWLTYEFTDRQPDKATVALKWEELQVPFTVSVPNSDQIYVENLRRELRTSPGFNWQSWADAASWAIQNEVNLPEAETWAQNAVSLQFIGQENFRTLSVLARAQAANGKEAQAKATLDKALNHPTAGPIDLHMAARQLQTEGKSAEAVRIFHLNAKRHPGVWPVDVGLARAYAAEGKTKEALKHAKMALAKAPDPGNRQNLEQIIQRLEKGEAIN